MRLCFLVDARSPIAANWISYFVKKGYDVHVISSHACPPDVLKGATLYQAPIAFGGISRSSKAASGNGKPQKYASIISAVRRLDRMTKGALRSWFSPIDLLPHVRTVRRLCDMIEPDLVHAMRIPYEGIMAALAVRKKPLLISCWGNDFTLFTTTAADRFLTRRAMRRADALHCDCERDVKLAGRWDFGPDKPSIVLPGAGGVDMSVFHPGEPRLNGSSLDLPPGARVIINPRGLRMYVRNDAFFHAIPLILREEPLSFFICVGMQGEPYAEKVVRDLGIASHVRLLPAVNQDELAKLFRTAEVSVSPSTHDGTPNTLLEAMASGCVPVAGGIESVREWIDHGSNGLLCDPASAGSIAAEVIRVLRDKELRRRATVRNLALTSERADCRQVMPRAEAFYHEVIDRCSPAE
jgi:glycosyltransferase involved in cell wall biosynthesis